MGLGQIFLGLSAAALLHNSPTEATEIKGIVLGSTLTEAKAAVSSLTCRPSSMNKRWFDQSCEAGIQYANEYADLLLNLYGDRVGWISVTGDNRNWHTT